MSPKVRNAVALNVALVAGALWGASSNRILAGHVSFPIVLLVLAALGLLVAAFRIVHSPIESLEHQHAWGMWEDCQLQDGGAERWSGDEFIARMVPGQKRECFGCGEREVRMVIA